MILIPALILAAGLNTAASTPLPASHAQNAEIRLDRMVAAAAPAIHRRTVNRAIAAGTRRIGSDIARELARTHVSRPGRAAPTAQARPLLLSEEPPVRLETRHFSPLPKPDPISARAESGGTGASPQVVPGTSQPSLSVRLLGELLTGFLALAGIAAAAFSHWTS